MSIPSPESIFIEQRNEVSGRFAIIVGNGTSAWIHLTPSPGEGIDSDAFIYSPTEPAEELDIGENKNRETPILTKPVTSDKAVMTNIDDSVLSIKWSHDGHPAAVLYKDIPLAFIDNIGK